MDPVASTGGNTALVVWQHVNGAQRSIESSGPAVTAARQRAAPREFRGRGPRCKPLSETTDRPGRGLSANRRGGAARGRRCRATCPSGWRCCTRSSATPAPTTASRGGAARRALGLRLLRAARHRQPHDRLPLLLRPRGARAPLLHAVRVRPGLRAGQPLGVHRHLQQLLLHQALRRPGRHRAAAEWSMPSTVSTTPAGSSVCSRRPSAAGCSKRR